MTDPYPPQQPEQPTVGQPSPVAPGPSGAGSAGYGQPHAPQPYGEQAPGQAAYGQPYGDPGAGYAQQYGDPGGYAQQPYGQAGGYAQQPYVDPSAGYAQPVYAEPAPAGYAQPVYVPQPVYVQQPVYAGAYGPPLPPKDVGIAYLWGAATLFGVAGLQHFYLGKPVRGVIWLLTWGVCGIGSLVDLFTLPEQTRQVNARRAHGIG